MAFNTSPFRPMTGQVNYQAPMTDSMKPTGGATVTDTAKTASSSPIAGIFQKIFGKDSNPAPGGVGMLGDFDSESFVEGSLKKAQDGGGDLGKVIGGLMKMVGMGG